ncbi:MAG: cupin domain-containing protein [Planktothrix sp. GU0601_MAG3]|nr:MAG: cupin domain-containing protein [Planktothrix sp. GU0601_MAG3]
MTQIILNLKEKIKYSESGIFSSVLWKNDICQYTLFCLAKGTDISEHTSTQNATVQVLEGEGILTLNGEDIQLEPGIFIVMAANAPHALKAESNLAFLLTLSTPES